MSTPTEFWEGFYGDGDRWSGNANELLVAELVAVDDQVPGDALDVGCGEGGDAIWLAARGWRVTAVDISAAALAAAARHAAAAGVGDAITWERHELPATFPTGTYDLVASAYLHSPVELDRVRILRAAAALVRPGGRFVVVGHAGPPSWATPELGAMHGHGVEMPSAADVVADLDLGPDWVVERAADVQRAHAAPDGSPGTRPDSVVRARRLRRA
jgi:SAM-dependent methyltransferase